MMMVNNDIFLSCPEGEAMRTSIEFGRSCTICDDVGIDSTAGQEESSGSDSSAVSCRNGYLVYVCKPQS